MSAWKLREAVGATTQRRDTTVKETVKTIALTALVAGGIGLYVGSSSEQTHDQTVIHDAAAELHTIVTTAAPAQAAASQTTEASPSK